jgi:hypothetical protein
MADCICSSVTEQLAGLLAAPAVGSLPEPAICPAGGALVEPADPVVSGLSVLRPALPVQPDRLTAAINGMRQFELAIRFGMALVLRQTVLFKVDIDTR